MDWSQLIKDLEACGWSLTSIGAEVGLSVASISDIKQGRTKCPRGMPAVELHKLHLNRLKKRAANSPQAKAAA